MAKRKNTGNLPSVPAARAVAEISSLQMTLQAARAQLWSTTCNLLHEAGEEPLRTVLNAHAALYGRAS